MKRSMLPLTVLAALVAGLAISHLISPAQAQSQGAPSVICRWKFDGMATQARSDSVQAWMNEQVAAGRKEFVVVPMDAGSTLCAW